MMKRHSLERFWQPIVTQYLSGATALPPYLGLSEADYSFVLNTLGINDIAEYHRLPGRILREELITLRGDEFREIYALLSEYRHELPSPAFDNEIDLITQVLASACMGSKHLWHDLGLPERPRLSELFTFYFPELQKMNDKNMRWKRFLYKQLCEKGGDYICRAPSCEACSSYSECFIPDEGSICD
jgi:nitrogen fixation protein NifQ